MGTSPKTPTKRKQTKVMSFDELRRSSGKDITIQRGEVREGALDWRTNDEIESDDKKKRQSKALAADKKRREQKLKRAEEKAQRKRARTKVKASKKFDKAYDPSKASNRPSVSDSATSAPRPALYKGKMGSVQRKTAKMQTRFQHAGNGISKVAGRMPKLNLPDIPHTWRRVIGAVAIMALFAFCLYTPAQQYYQQMRETDRLQAEYAAVAARTSTLQSTISSLSSDEGVADKAHEDLGYIRSNEETATVKGAHLTEEHEFSSNVAPGSVPAPKTWYSPFLDILFGYLK